jgi:hypothetical protein
MNYEIPSKLLPTGALVRRAVARARTALAYAEAVEAWRLAQEGFDTSARRHAHKALEVEA